MEKYFDNSITVILVVICSILVLICMILNIVSYSKFSFSSSNIHVFADNFKSYPITEIGEFKGDCPSGWEPLIGEKWPGFVQGCDCTDSWGDSEILREIHRGSCSVNETMAYCKDLPAQQPLPFTVYRKSTICKKHASENFYDFKTQKKISKESYCGLGSKLCGKLDTTGNYLCISESESCPINKIIIQDTKDTKPTGKNYTSIELGNGKSLYYSNQNATKDDSIYTDLRISEGLPCLNSNQLNTKSRSSKYILDAKYDMYVCTEFLNKKYFDDRYKSIDSFSYLDLIKENKINYVIDRYPEFPDSALNFEVQLYSRPYFGWKASCLSDRGFNLDFLSSLGDSLESLSGKLLALMIISIITFTLYLINFAVLVTSEKLVSAVFLCVISALNFAMIIIAFSAYSVSKGFAKENEDLKNFACGDEYMNMFLDYLFDFMQFLPGMVLWNGLLLVFNLVLKVCPFFFGYRKHLDVLEKLF